MIRHPDISRQQEGKAQNAVGTAVFFNQSLSASYLARFARLIRIFHKSQCIDKSLLIAGGLAFMGKSTVPCNTITNVEREKLNGMK